MNPFGQELRKILTQCKTSGVVSYAGRSAYIQLDPDLRARLEFVALMQDVSSLKQSRQPDVKS